MSLTAFLYILALIMAGVLLFGAVYFVIMLTDLECDYINPIDLANNLNTYVMPEMAAQLFLFVTFLLVGEWMSMLLNLPLVGWNIVKVINARQFYDATEVFRTLPKHKRENFVKVAFYLVCFFYYLYSMIITLVNESTTPDHQHPEVMHTQEEDDAAVSEEIARYRNIVLSACSSLGNMQPKDVTATLSSPAKDGPPTMHYVPSKDCLGSLKDIKRYIQLDEQGEGKLVLQWLGEWSILERDIVPIFIINAKTLLGTAAGLRADSDGGGGGSDDEQALKIVVSCVELFVFLTWSMDSETEEVKMQFIRILRSYKRAFANDELVFCLLAIAVMYMKRGSALSEKEWMMVKGILYVFRNILAIPDPLVSPSSGAMSAQVEVHDKLIAVLEKQMAIDFFLTLASSADQRRMKDLRKTLLDIIYYLFYRVPVAALFSQPQDTWFKDSEHHRSRSSRHNNFGGVYAVSTGEGSIMPVFNTREVLQPFANLFKKRAKVQKPKETGQTPVDRQWRTVNAESILILRRIAAVFIESCYNPFVGALFDDSRSGVTVVDEFTPRLLYMAAYFVDISLANSAIELGCTCTLVQTHTFGLVMRHASSYVELKEWNRLEPAMYCIQQILLALSKMRRTKLASLGENVLSNLFYDGDALDLFVQLCRVYKPTRTSRGFLEQVARLTETFLDTLKGYAETKVGMTVKKRVKKRVPKVKKNDDADPDSATNAEAMEIDDEDIGDESREVEDIEESLVERDFNMKQYETAFAVSDVVKAYSHLLAPPTSMEYVFPMLYRIAVTCQRPHLFFKKNIMLRLLLLFDDQYTYPRRSEVTELAAWIFRQYLTVISSPALTNQFKAEPLNDRMAVECVLAFLKRSGMGKTIEPVITKHLIKLQAEGAGDDGSPGKDADDTADAAESHPLPVSGAAPAAAGSSSSLASGSANNYAAGVEINENELDDYGLDDFDFDF
ncbi:Topoisomerase 1-associated factor 1 [Coemansia interrupta]|uniref:Topoisomerase 1-associated factor 1 n=1 Tax=Coemansia interrupta TaxID=1126814 RepID=A0A9W8HAK5_9FUNG|nr:Topoisomerase 1-associated factor 1 [Coemansia interrupta]